MTLEELKAMIIGDLEIDKTELDLESIKTPQIHNKYLSILMEEKLTLTRLRNDYSAIKKNKWLYYTGKMSQEELDFFEWEPFQHNILKADIDKFMDSDDDILKIRTKITFQEEKVSFIEETLKMINNRQWLIRSAIDWIKFTNGTT
jgi:hypothetical protein|tara:strand:+ start:182 stop:619 length:438 start_codon:yes stop_codon:yes gene_type:complete